MKRTVPSRLSISSERQGGLAGPNLAGQDDEALAFADSTRKGSVGLLKNRIVVKNADRRITLKDFSKAEIVYRWVFIRSAPVLTEGTAAAQFAICQYIASS